MKYGPDFICIGAQKSGTSWLFENLARHSKTKMPPVKEVNFFYPPSPTLKQRIRMGIRSRSKIIWSARYMFYEHTPKNYVKLFPKCKNQISGDVSPSYIALTEQQVKMLAENLSEVKIIYLIRNPIERAWSAFRMKHFEFLQSPLTEVEILNHAKNHDGFSHGKYTEILNRWEKYFPGRVKVWFFDQLCEDPKKLFFEICQYLNLTLNRENDLIEEKVFEGKHYPMPESVRNYLNMTFRNEIIALHTRFNNIYTLNWLKTLENDGVNVK